MNVTPICWKESAIQLREKVSTVIREVESNWNCDIDMEDHEKKHILKLYRETMLNAYNFGFEVSHNLQNKHNAYNFGFELRHCLQNKQLKYLRKFAN